MSKRLRILFRPWTRLATVVLILFPGGVSALQDPTRPPGLESAIVAPVPEKNLSLDSILYSEGRRVAVIDGEALREDQGIDSLRVIRIYDNRVLVTDNGRERVLYLERLPQVRGTQ
ncbi:hypothetical protein [Marinobacter sp. SS8-8]|jgi:MSHA biogenesis protein MshK|uniref:hypothetical protein n=1 Tax=Marinobacter sp. SS8-8 TaxID=3050452 RepID=UPI0026E05F7B|nr:hypothetical protein [Marinobacter sp. SS8-8]|tara:strand:- start:81891 stop:82238 length:348 start_codon:yes stop_codon:yes gene_type:complete